MTTAASGQWTPSPVSTSVQDRWFFSGELTSQNAYVNLDFGFSASVVKIVCKGTNRLAIRFPGQRAGVLDGGIVEGSASLEMNHANKTGVDVRSETSGSASVYYVMAWG